MKNLKVLLVISIVFNLLSLTCMLMEIMKPYHGPTIYSNLWFLFLGIASILQLIYYIREKHDCNKEFKGQQYKVLRFPELRRLSYNIRNRH